MLICFGGKLLESHGKLNKEKLDDRFPTHLRLLPI